MCHELKSAENKVVGLKQLLRGLEADEVLAVYIADDAEEHVKERILSAVGEKDVHIVYVQSMRDLGNACGIDVPASCAAIIKN